MCLNCGCKEWNDDMGSEDNITLDDVVKAAKASGQDGATTLRHMKDAAESITPQQLDEAIAA